MYTSRSRKPGIAPPVVLYAALREPSYVRNLVTLRSLSSAGFTLIQATSSRTTYPRRLAEVAAKLLRAAIARKFDVVVVGFLAQPLVPIIRAVTSKPLVVDGFISLYDTLCFDRRRFRPHSWAGRFLRWLDIYAFRQADILVVDTDEHGDYFAREFAVERSKLRTIPVGADDELFSPRPDDGRAARPSVFYYATGLPVHGLGYVVEAARLLAAEDITIRVAAPPALIADAPTNLTRLGWISVDRVAQEMAAADVVLAGHFSTLPKAQRVVAGKAYQAMACARPTIVSDLPANRAALTDGVTAFFCQAGDAASIAQAIRRVVADPRKAERVGQQARRLYEARWRLDVLTQQWDDAVWSATLESELDESGSPLGSRDKSRSEVASGERSLEVSEGERSGPE